MKNRFMVRVIVLAILFMAFGSFNAMAEEKVKMGGHFKFAHSKSAGVIGNPLEIRGWNHEFIDNTLQTLIRNSNDKIGEQEALLAESWQLATDRSHYIFKLREGLKFHDGTVCDAQAVKWNLDNWVKAKRERLDKVTSVDVLDPRTIKVNLSGWDAITVNDFSKDTFIISPTAFEKNGKEWADYNPVGTGPFMLVNQKRNTYLEFDKFKDYWVKGEPFVDKMTIYTIPDPMTAMAALKSQEVDAWLGVDSVSAREAIDGGKLNYQLFDAIYDVIQFNSVDPESVWSKEKMRQAIEYAIDKEALVKAVSRGLGKAVYTCIHSAPEGSGTVPRKYDPVKAKALVKEAGYPDGVKVNILFQSNPQAKNTAVALQSMLKEAGIEVMPTPLEGAKYQEVLFQPTTHGDLIMGNLRGGAAEVLTSADENFGKGSVFFQSIAKPEGFQAAIEQAMQSDNREKINDLIKKAEKMAYDTAMIVPVTQAKFAALQQPYVKGANWFWAGSPYPYLSRTWLDK
jgi:peptide/nickel transport system substrate-binding protein